jgi:hypothetical protein
VSPLGLLATALFECIDVLRQVNIFFRGTPGVFAVLKRFLDGDRKSRGNEAAGRRKYPEAVLKRRGRKKE